MARAIQDIYAELVLYKENDINLGGLNSTSKTAIWRLWLYVIAFATWTMENLFDAHKAEVSDILLQQKPHTKTWYRNKALAFQFGFDLYADTDVFNNQTYTDDQIAASKIIKYAAVTEATVESRLIIKIATEDTSAELAPISPAQTASFIAYINEIRDPIKITVINYLPDILRLNLNIYYDPLVLTSDGVSILTAKKPVEIALKEFMKELPFDGMLILASLVDKLQQTEGVKIPNLISAASSWIDDAGISYGNFTNISVRKVPVSGYFKIENFVNITYLPN